MRTRWPGFAAFHSGHVPVVEFISAVWRRLRSFARCVASVEQPVSGAVVIAEGVENEFVADLMKAAGIRHG